MTRYRGITLFLTAASLLRAQADPLLYQLDGVWRAEFNAEASRLMVQMRDGALGLWDVASGQPVAGDLGTLRHQGTFATDATHRHLVAGFREGGSQVYNFSTGRAVSPVLKVSFDTTQGASPVFSADSSLLLVFDKTGPCHVLEVALGTTRAVLPLPPPSADFERQPRAEFSKDGNTVLLLDTSGILHRYDTRSWSQTSQPMIHPGRDASNCGFAMSADARFAVTFDSPGENGPDGQLQLWDTTTATPLAAPLAGKNGMAGQFLGDGHRLLIQPGRGDTRVVEVPSLNLAYSLPPHDDVEATKAILTGDGRHLLTWGQDSFLKRVSVSDGKLAGLFSNRARLETILIGPDPKTAWLAYDNTAFLLEHHHDHYMIRIDLGTMQPAASLRTTNYLHRSQLSPDGSRIMIHEGLTDHERIRLFESFSLSELPASKDQ